MILPHWLMQLLSCYTSVVIAIIATSHSVTISIRADVGFVSIACAVVAIIRAVEHCEVNDNDDDTDDDSSD